MNTLFPLADRLHELRGKKDELKAALKDTNEQICAAEQDLAEAMTEAACPNFTRSGNMFILTTTTRWSAEKDCKDALYTALREQGYEHLFTVNSQTLGSFIREQVRETEDENGETSIPGWLEGLVKSYNDVGITVKSK